MNFSYNEFAVKNVYNLVKDDEELIAYKDSDQMSRGKYFSKEFFWEIAFSIQPEWANEYYKKVLAQSNALSYKIP